MRWRLALILGWSWEFIRAWPGRFMDLVRWMAWIDRPKHRHVLPRWLAGLGCLLADLTPLALAAESIFLLACRRCRPLHPWEQGLAHAVFGECLDPRLLVLGSPSRTAALFRTSAFVTCHTIHVASRIDDPVLVHELVHCWQYRRLGSRYIPEALWAQRWGGGYSFDGESGLEKGRLRGGLDSFNVEQQAMIIETWYRARMVDGRDPPAILGAYHADLGRRIR